MSRYDCPICGSSDFVTYHLNCDITDEEKEAMTDAEFEEAVKKYGGYWYCEQCKEVVDI